MNLIHKIESWGDAHHPGILDILRIALGLFLLFKGLTFMENTAYLRTVLNNQGVIEILPNLLMVLVYSITFAHMVGGLLIALGTLTRAACLIQIPIVLGAVFLVSVFNDPGNAVAWPSIAALGLLVVFAIMGSGPWSLDRYNALNEKVYTDKQLIK